jgi:hypothetical protein
MEKSQPLWLGGLEWRCLAEEAGRALYITKDVVEKRAYHASYSGITWEGCALRQYLNGEFLRRFSPQEQAAVLETTLTNKDNAQYNTRGGNATKDKIFLLSVEEAQKYFASDSERVAKFNNSGFWWWLRSPGTTQDDAARVHNDGTVYLRSYGVDLYGNLVRLGEGGVRPALWLNREQNT